MWFEEVFQKAKNPMSELAMSPNFYLALLTECDPGQYDAVALDVAGLAAL